MFLYFYFYWIFASLRTHYSIRMHRSWNLNLTAYEIPRFRYNLIFMCIYFPSSQIRSQKCQFDIRQSLKKKILPHGTTKLICKLKFKVHYFSIEVEMQNKTCNKIWSSWIYIFVNFKRQFVSMSLLIANILRNTFFNFLYFHE